MAEYHVGCGWSGIFAGTLNKKTKNGIQTWRNKSDVTEEAIGAVAQYLRMKCTPENGNEYGFVWDLGENEKLHLTVKIENKDM